MPSRSAAAAAAASDGIVDPVAVARAGTGPSRREPTKTFVVRGTRFEVADKYTLIKAVGKGAYGVVCSCRDKETGRKVAVKKVEDAIVDGTDAKRTLREIKLLRFLNHENIIALVDIQPPASYDQFTDVYEITELMDTDLHQ
jgi:mitogen-activated protein kinase 1/3